MLIASGWFQPPTAKPARVRVVQPGHVAVCAARKGLLRPGVEGQRQVSAAGAVAKACAHQGFVCRSKLLESWLDMKAPVLDQGLPKLNPLPLFFGVRYGKKNKEKKGKMNAKKLVDDGTVCLSLFLISFFFFLYYSGTMCGTLLCLRSTTRRSSFSCRLCDS